MKLAEFDQALAGAEQLYSASQVRERIGMVAESINSYMRASDDQTQVVALTVMNGALIFAGSLLPALQFPLVTDYIHATRYGASKQGGELALLAEPKTDLNGARVLLIDDIFDDGLTLERVRQYCLDRGACEVVSAVLAWKDKARPQGAATRPEFIALNVPDEFVFGFGMDVGGYLRNAPGIYYQASGGL